MAELRQYLMTADGSYRRIGSVADLSPEFIRLMNEWARLKTTYGHLPEFADYVRGELEQDS